jgi:hypothetical protein
MACVNMASLARERVYPENQKMQVIFSLLCDGAALGARGRGAAQSLTVYRRKALFRPIADLPGVTGERSVTIRKKLQCSTGDVRNREFSRR